MAVSLEEVYGLLRENIAAVSALKDQLERLQSESQHTAKLGERLAVLEWETKALREVVGGIREERAEEQVQAFWRQTLAPAGAAVGSGTGLLSLLWLMFQTFTG